MYDYNNKEKQLKQSIREEVQLVESKAPLLLLSV